MRDAGKTSWIQDWAQSWVQGNVSDVMAVPVGAVLGVLMVIFFYLLYMNYTGDIKHWDGAPAEGALDVFSIDTVGRESSASSPSKSTMKDKDDLTETFAAVDAIERAVQHGNIAGARSVLAPTVTLAAPRRSVLASCARYRLAPPSERRKEARNTSAS